MRNILHRRAWLLLIGLLGLHFVLTCRLAIVKIIWTDEFFTLYLARLPGWHDLSSALLTGGDQHPPLFYLIHAFFLRVAGESEFALRLPELLASVLMCICLYFFSRRRTTPLYGAIAMALPLATAAHSYTYEARGYGLVLGFLSLAVLSWQQLGERRWRAVSAIGMGAGLAAATGSHYYAVLCLPALGLAEIVRSARRRKVDLLVWLAMCAPAVTLAAGYTYIHAATTFAATFWAKPEWAEIHRFYSTLLAPAMTGVGGGLLLAGLYATISPRFWERRPSIDQQQPIEEIILAFVLACTPVLGLAVGKTITNAFVWRYAIGGVIGIAILFGFCCFTLFRGNDVAALLIITALGLGLTASLLYRAEVLATEKRDLQDLIHVLESVNAGPIVTGSSDLFYKISYYGSPEHKHQYIFLGDTERARKYLGFDTVDRSLLALNAWFGLHVERYEDFIARKREYIGFSDMDPRWDWVPSALLDDRRQLRALKRKGPLLLFSVSTP
jgi:hypothetical protein